MVIHLIAVADFALGVENDVIRCCSQFFVAETGGRRKILLPFSWWSAVDMGAGGFNRIIFTITIIINTNHTYIRQNIPVHITIEGTRWRSWYDIFVNCNWVVTRWQYTFTHKQYIQQYKTNNTYNNTTILEECGPCSVLASITLAFALQPRKKHGKTSVRVAASKNMYTTISIHRQQ